MSREVLRHAEFEGKVRLGRVRDHFICTFHSARLAMIRVANLLLVGAVNVESAGQYRPEELVPEAIQVLLSKVRELRKCLGQLKV